MLCNITINYNYTFFYICLAMATSVLGFGATAWYTTNLYNKNEMKVYKELLDLKWRIIETDARSNRVESTNNRFVRPCVDHALTNLKTTWNTAMIS